MLDIGWQELFVVAAIAVIVVGPKDLPRAISQVSKAIRKARGLARDFQNSIDDVVREAELEDLRKQVESSKNFDIGKELKNAVDPDDDFGDQFKDIQTDLDKTAKSLGDDGDAKPAKPQVQGPPAPEPKPQPEKKQKAEAKDTDDAKKPSTG